MRIACAADDRYLPHCAAMLASLLTHNSNVAVHFMHSRDVDRGGLQQIGELVRRCGGSLRCHEIPDAWIEGLPGIRQIPPIMWYRVFLPKLLPDAAKVLYLDADTIVLDCIDELWQTDISGYFVAAVRNVFESKVSDWPTKIGVCHPERYFNSGVMLMNLEMMRRGCTAEKLVALGRNSQYRLKWPDQDALNLVLGERVCLLHPRWNCQNSFFYLSEAKVALGAEILAETLRQPGIIHFEGAGMVKPWHFLSRHPYKNIYLNMRKITPWSDVEFEGKTLVNRALRWLPISWSVFVFKASFRLRRQLKKYSK